MEIFGNKIYDECDIIVYHSIFKKMELLLLYKNNIFLDCLILNLNEDLYDVSKYHFYTIEYYVKKTIFKLCIKPRNVVENYANIAMNQNEIHKISELIKKGGNNNYRIKVYNFDPLGQEHGSEAEERYRKLLRDKEVSSNILYIEGKNKINNIEKVLTVLKEIGKEEIINKIFTQELIKIDKLFEKPI